MEQFIGLDVSLKDTFISVREEGRRVWRGKCASDPKLIAEFIRKRAMNAERVVFETGPLSTWFYHALTLEGLPAICIDARHAKAVLEAILAAKCVFYIGRSVPRITMLRRACLDRVNNPISDQRYRRTPKRKAHSRNESIDQNRLDGGTIKRPAWLRHPVVTIANEAQTS